VAPNREPAWGDSNLGTVARHVTDRLPDRKGFLFGLPSWNISLEDSRREKLGLIWLEKQMRFKVARRLRVCPKADSMVSNRSTEDMV
jgi:hypothetical protein